MNLKKGNIRREIFNHTTLNNLLNGHLPGIIIFLSIIPPFDNLLKFLELHGLGLRILILLTIIAINGTLIGTALSYRVSPAILEKWFAVFVIVVATFLIVGDYVVLF